MNTGWAFPLPLTISFGAPALREPWAKGSRAPLARSKRQHRLHRSLADLAEMELVQRVHGASWPQEPKMDSRGVQRPPSVSEHFNFLVF